MSAVYLIEGIVVFLVALIVVSRAFGWVQSWLEAREQERLERQRQLLEESYRVYQASRAIYDQTAAALQEMLSTQRDRDPEAVEVSVVPPPRGNPIVRLVVAVFLIAVGIRLTIEMLRPVFPVLLVIAIAAAVVYVVAVIRRGRDRW